MQYKLINTTTKEEFICEKVVVDGYEYYVNDSEIIKDEFYISLETNYATEPKERYVLYCLGVGLNGENPKKVIATTNPSLDIPQIIDEFEELKKEYFKSWSFGETNPNHFYNVLRDAYKKAKEQYQYTKQDMIEFAEWKDKLSPSQKVSVWSKNGESKGLFNMDNEQLLEKFENTRPKTIYFK